ncbi:hypothetical protein AcdelDRAFT_4409 [Acidovorax delafieldii 2AN]|uniref:Uncharacterized protein n=1 Tax=Acidovorax delafieldii 2AN TaxID=573060 RepID=C5TBX9_ACIDE|nr:hypothetical protein [Acidovorax delafieldii]EER58019.1 hypothetical protein AcdelDRAFT_4409 [Acidovorax delafieldii 2AN]
MRFPPFLALWGGPIAMALLSATGLATALVSDTWGDWWSWVGLGVPVALMGWCCRPRAATRTPTPTPRAHPPHMAVEAPTHIPE